MRERAPKEKRPRVCSRGRCKNQSFFHSPGGISALACDVGDTSTILPSGRIEYSIRPSLGGSLQKSAQHSKPRVVSVCVWPKTNSANVRDSLPMSHTPFPFQLSRLCATPPHRASVARSSRESSSEERTQAGATLRTDSRTTFAPKPIK